MWPLGIGKNVYNIFPIHPIRAERTPVNGYGVAKFDPINNCISIYADTLNIFIRIAQILAMGGNRRK